MDREVKKIDEQYPCEPCLHVVLLEERYIELRKDHEELKKCKVESILEINSTLQEIRADQIAIKMKLEKQVGFFAGITALATALISLVGVGLGYFKG